MPAVKAQQSVHLAPGFRGLGQFGVFLQHPLGVLELGVGGGKAPVLGFYHIGVQAAADAETAPARGIGLGKSPVGVADAAGDVGGEGGGAGRNPQGARRQFHLALAVHELVKADEHFHAQIPRHIVAGGASEIPHPVAGRGDFVGVGDAHGGLNVGADFHRAGADAPFRFQTADDFVHPADFGAVFRFGVVHLHEAGPDYGIQVGFHQVVVDAAHRVGAPLVHHRDAGFHQVARLVLQVGRNGVLQIHIDEVAAPMPGVVDKPLRNYGHRQAGALHAPGMLRHNATSC